MSKSRSPSQFLTVWLGASLPALVRIFRRYSYRPHPRYYPRLALLLLSSIGNLFLGLIQEGLFYRRIRRATIMDPVFIVGHWRSGTSLLHELVASDERFSSPTYYTCLQPNHFLLSEWIGRAVMNLILPATRTVDGMASDSDLPTEDELALLLLGASSPYTSAAFPMASERTCPGTPIELWYGETEEWQRAFTWFLRRLQTRNPNRLLLKSPTHSFRIAVLSRIFPGAKFIHVHRNPIDVALSMLGAAAGFEDLLALEPNTQSSDERLEDILSTGRKLYSALEEIETTLSGDRLHTISYDELIADPLATIGGIYSALDLGDFETARPAIQQSLRTRSSYRPEARSPNPQQAERITQEWAGIAKRLGY